MAQLAHPQQVHPKSPYWDHMMNLRLTGTLCDIQLCVKDEEGTTLAIPAHKLILVGSSKYFIECLENHNLLDVYNFDGVSLQALQLVLDYMYRQTQWQTVTQNPEAAAIAETLQVIEHTSPLDSPVFRDKDGASVMIMEKIVNTKGQRSPVKRKPGPRARSNIRVFEDEDELNKALALHRMRTLAKSSAETTPKALQLSPGDALTELIGENIHIARYDDDSAVQEQQHYSAENSGSQETGAYITTMAKESVLYAEGNSVQQVSVESGDANMVEEVVQHHQNVEVREVESIDTTEEVGVEVQHQGGDGVEAGEVEDIITQENVVVVKTEKEETTEIVGFPAGSKMDLLASASEMVQRQQLVEEGRKVKEGSQENTEEQMEPMILDHVTGNLVVDDTDDVEEGEDGNDVADEHDHDIVKEDVQSVKEGMQSVKAGLQSVKIGIENVKVLKEGREIVIKEELSERRSVRIAKRKDVPSFAKASKRHKKQERDEEQRVKDMPQENPNRNSAIEDSIKKERKSLVMSHVKVIKPIRSDVSEEAEEEEDSERVSDEMKDTNDEEIMAEEEMECNEEDEQLVEEDRIESEEEEDKKPMMVGNPVRKNVGRLMKIATPQKVTDFQCEICQAYFVNITGYKNHKTFKHDGVKVHPEDGTVHSCDRCGAKFKTFAALSTHLRIQHGMDDGYICGECTDSQVKFKYHRQLKNHMIREHNLVLWHCDICEQPFKSAEGYKIHMFKQHSGAPPSNVCDLCGKGFVREAELRNHQRVTHTSERKFPCLVCQQSGTDIAFKTHNALRRHILTVHRENRDYKCDLCDSAFKTKNDMYRHRMKHLRDERPLPQGMRRRGATENFSCTICGKTYKTSSSLGAHQRVQHQEKDSAVSYMCTLCNKSFAVKQYLLMHLRNIHEPKKYQCEACGLSFAQRYELRRHQPKCRGYHLGHKPYGCVQCGKTFTLKGNLTKHLSTSCKGRKKVVGVDFVLMVQKEAENTQCKEEAEYEEVSNSQMESAAVQVIENQMGEEQHHHLQEHEPTEEYVIQEEGEVDDGDHEGGVGTEEEEAVSEQMLVHVERRREDGSIVFEQVSLGEVLQQHHHHQGGGGAEGGDGTVLQIIGEQQQVEGDVVYDTSGGQEVDVMYELVEEGVSHEQV